MKTTIKIKVSKMGYVLMVNGCYIAKSDYEGNTFVMVSIKAIWNETGIPYGATEWVSIAALHTFWRLHMHSIIEACNKPYKSFWGQLVPI